MKPYRVPLVRNTIRNIDLTALNRWLRRNPQLTKGPVSAEFEQKFSRWLGVKHAHYVNSGSSANLLAINTLLIAGFLNPGDQIIAPAVSWTTTVAPITQLNCQPVLCDCDKETLGLDLKHLELLLKQTKAKVVIICHVLGIPGHLKEIITLCKKHHAIIVEDCCESLGSQYAGAKVGNFGLISTFSFYYGHHLSTIEGGMICTNSQNFSNIIRSLRSHGWDRDLDPRARQRLRSKYRIDPFSAKYTFYYPGYNFRGNDLNAYLGIRQLRRLNSVINKRQSVWQRYYTQLKNAGWRPNPPQGSKVSGFSFPLLSPKRQVLAKELESEGVETRPLISGSVGRQPWFIEKYGTKILPHADIIHKHGLYVPINPDMTIAEINKITRLALNHKTASVKKSLLS